MDGSEDEGSERTELLPEPEEPPSTGSGSLEGGERRERKVELEKLLGTAGYGFFHVVLLSVCGLALAADGVEVLGVGFVVPVAERDLHLSTARKGYLDASVFVGMLVGGLLWGNLSDVFGRKGTLLVAIQINGVCGLVAAFSPNFWFFFIFRFASGLGIGGSIPIVYSYLAEFFKEKQRGPVIVILSGCWPIGVVLVATLAWGILGTESSYHTINFYVGSLHFVNWRLFLVVLTVPAFLFVILFLFLPESPAYLHETGQKKSLLKVLERIHKVNSLCCCWCYRPTGNLPKLVTNQIELLPLSSPSESPQPPPTDKPCLSRVWLCCCDRTGFKKAVAARLNLFSLEYLRATILLSIIHFCQFFAIYGLLMWVPEYFKRLRARDCSHAAAMTHGNCSEDGPNLQFYQDSLYLALASLPGIVLGLILINVLGAKILTVLATLVAALCTFLIWGLPDTHGAVLASFCSFATSFAVINGAISLLEVNIYDVTLRSSSQGLFNGIGRVGAILANIMFGHLLDVSRGIPILIVALVLTCSAVAVVFIPHSYNVLEHHPPLERAVSWCEAWLCSKLCHRKHRTQSS